MKTKQMSPLQTEAASHSQALVFMRDFNHHWRESRAGHRQDRWFLECVNDNLLYQERVETMRTGALSELKLIFTTKEMLVGNVKLKGSFGCSNHEMVQLRILRAVRRAHSKLAVQDFRRADFGLLISLLEPQELLNDLPQNHRKFSWLLYGEQTRLPY